MKILLNGFEKMWGKNIIGLDTFVGDTIYTFMFSFHLCHRLFPSCHPHLGHCTRTKNAMFRFLVFFQFQWTAAVKITASMKMAGIVTIAGKISLIRLAARRRFPLLSSLRSSNRRLESAPSHNFGGLLSGSKSDGATGFGETTPVPSGNVLLKSIANDSVDSLDPGIRRSHNAGNKFCFFELKDFHRQ